MPFWTHTIELGNASLVFPLAVLIALIAICRRDYVRAGIWLISFGIGVLLIVAGKFAFDFGGYAWPEIGLYSISGHAMLTTALYPVLLGLLVNRANKAFYLSAVACGFVVAAIMAIVLVAGEYHTVTETLAGTLIGLTVALINVGQFAPLRWLPVSAVAILTFVMEIAWPLSTVHTAEHGLWMRAGQWFGMSGRYARLIIRDPRTGSTVIIVKRPSPRASVSAADTELAHIKPSLLQAD